MTLSKNNLFVALTLALFFAACGQQEPLAAEAPRHVFEQPDAASCESITGVVEASDAGKAEDIADVEYRVVKHSSRIEFAAIGRDGVEIGAGSTEYQVPSNVSQKIITHTTFTDDFGSAEELGTTRVLNNIMLHRTVTRAGGVESILIWSQGTDGLAIDASAGIASDREADGETIFALPEGNFALIEFLKNGEQIKDQNELDAFAREFGLIALDSNRTYRRMHAIGNDEGWRASLELKIGVCEGAVALTYAGPVNCSSSNPFQDIASAQSIYGVVADGRNIALALGTAGVVTTAGGAAAAFIGATVAVYVVGNGIEAFVNSKAAQDTGLNVVEALLEGAGVVGEGGVDATRDSLTSPLSMAQTMTCNLQVNYC